MFLKSYSSTKVRRSKFIDINRINGALTDIIRRWFRYLSLPSINDIKPANRYTIDKSGILEGRGGGDLVLGSSENEAIPRKQSESRVWASFVECVSATGQALRSLVVFKGKTV